MRILITAGGTTESIDAVRGISNFASGRLGQLVAECFLSAGDEVIFLAAPGSHQPDEQKKLRIIKITSVSDLETAMKEILPDVDVVVHTMAVSDYSPLYVEELSAFPENIKRDQLPHRHVTRQGKISSKAEYQILVLKKTPKIIQMIKALKPSVLLFGFKLMVDVSRETLIQTAQESLIKNQADYIIANDLKNIHQDKQLAYLIGGSSPVKFDSKSEIADAIVALSKEKIHD